MEEHIDTFEGVYHEVHEHFAKFKRFIVVKCPTRKSNLILSALNIAFKELSDTKFCQAYFVKEGDEIIGKYVKSNKIDFKTNLKNIANIDTFISQKLDKILENKVYLIFICGGLVVH